MTAERDLLRLLGEMPFLDRLEAAALSGWSRGAVYAACAALEAAGLVAPLPHAHASELLASTQRYQLTTAGLRRLAAEEGAGLGELLRSRPLTAHWRRLLLERLEGVASIYRLAAAITDAAWPLRFRWYRAMPMDAALALPGGRRLFVVREGQTADRTSFAKRLWRLREGPRPGACLLLVPDAVRLRHTARLMAQASVPAFLALEGDAATSGTSARIWRTASGSPLLSLREVLAHVARRGAWPEEEPLATCGRCWASPPGRSRSSCIRSRRRRSSLASRAGSSCRTAGWRCLRAATAPPPTSPCGAGAPGRSTRRRRSAGATSPAGAAASSCAPSTTAPPCTASWRR